VSISTSASVQFIDWLVANYDCDSLSWRGESGAIVYMQPGADLFIDATEELFDAWESLTWGEQRWMIQEAADQLLSIEQLAMAYA
jgi:hypothetical protein